jgi:hypothetical protein
MVPAADTTEPPAGDRQPKPKCLERAMSPSDTRSQLRNVVALADLLECVETGTASASPSGYRLLVQRLQVALGKDLPADALLAILDRYPATSEVYENMHYEHSGLFRAPLERSVSSELITTHVLRNVARVARKA